MSQTTPSHLDADDLYFNRMKAATDSLLQTVKMHPNAPWDALAMSAVNGADDYMATQESTVNVRTETLINLAELIMSPSFGPLMCTEACGVPSCPDDIRLQMVKEIQAWILEQINPTEPLLITKEDLMDVLTAMRTTNLE